MPAARISVLALRALSLSAGTFSGVRASRTALLRTASSLRGGRTSPLRMASTIPSPVEAPIALTKAETMTSDAAPVAWSGDLLVLPFWEAANASSLQLSESQAAVDGALDGALAELIADQEFKGAAGSSAVMALPKGAAGAKRLAIVGLGKEGKFAPSGAAKLGAALAKMASDQKAKRMAVDMPAVDAPLQQAALEAALLGLSPDTRYKSSKDGEENQPPPLVTLELLGGAVSEAAVGRARTFAAGVLLTKGLVGSPPNYLNPETMAETAAALASEFDTMSLRILEQAECEALGMGAYLGVAQGSGTPPKFIHLTYTPAGEAKKKVALVGKGLTFDSGGYNIKAGAGSMIEKMKFDMGGAGAVLGAARSVAELAPPGVEAHFIVAACENMVSAQAMRPGDILTASNKKTIEVINTDAEGRLTLADALVYADKLGAVDCIVDIATLTGACIVALGPDYGAVYTDSDDLLGLLTDSATAHGELLWRMPLAPEYAEQIKSPIADLKNLGAPGGGGSITAALFLKEFVGAESPDAMWAHLDIAGPVWNDKAGGATGYGVKTLVGLVEKMSSE